MIKENCPRKDTCFSGTGSSCPYCGTCEDFSNWEPEFPPRVAEMISNAMNEGATVFQMQQMDHGDWKEWHWDIFDKDPHKWFSIPIPWSLRISWTPERIAYKQYGKRWWRRLPLTFWWDSWVFTYYKNDTVQGCQCIGGPDIHWNRGLMYAASHYHCARMESLGHCPGGCENSCPHKDSAYGLE